MLSMVHRARLESGKVSSAYLAEDSSDIMGGCEKDSEYYLLDESDPERCKHLTPYLSRMGVATLDICSWINVR